MRFIKPGSRTLLLLHLSFGLAACGAGDRPVSASDNSYAVPVAAGCVAEGGKPQPPRPLKGRYTPEQWGAMPPGAKAQAVAAQAGHRMNFEDQLAASTAGCK
jgi:hypothetical protein